MAFFPWYNKKLIDFLNEFLNPGMDVFEYGAGHSTLYYSEKVSSVSAIETRQEWFNFVLKNQTKNNIEIKLCHNLQNFADEISSFIKKFDLIIIDSRDRAKCLAKSPFFLKENGMIILDNSERPNLKNSRELLKSQGFTENIYAGERIDGSISTASVFFQKKCF